jgi:hypothetical protein
MSVPVRIDTLGDGGARIAPAAVPAATDDAVAVDTAVLEVSGGHLSWSVLAPPSIPAAVLDDVELAQEWVWALYGERVALALADPPDTAVPAAPALAGLAATTWRLGYAHWAARWWPASGIDGIAALDDYLLSSDIAALTEECEFLLAGADAVAAEPDGQPISLSANDYALAAGSTADTARILGRGVGGWDWRRCPPGLLDASERAVSWQIIRSAGATLVRAQAVAAPGIPPRVPDHLRPWARVRTTAGAVAAELTLRGDVWAGEVAAPGAESGVAVDIYLPGCGAEIDDPDAAARRRRVREFAAARLRRAGAAAPDAADVPLRAEIAAAASDSDF